MPFYLHKRVLGELKTRFDYIFTTENKYPGSPVVEARVIEKKPFELNNLEVIPINGYHNGLQVFGYRFLNFAYLTDMKTIDSVELEKLKNLDVWIVDCVRYEPHYSHSHLALTLGWIEELKPKMSILTHMGHWLDYKELKNKLPSRVVPGYDGLSINST